jgi:hypothetical protein
MILYDLVRFTMGILGILTACVCYWLVTQGLCPGLVQRTSACYRKPVRITLAGLVLVIPLVTLGVFLFQGLSANPAWKFVGGYLIALPVLIGLIGSSGLCHRVGTGLASPVDEQQPWRCLLRGGIVLALTFLLPIAGWIFILPWTLISGCGALLLSFRTGRPQDQRVVSEATLSSAAGIPA